MRINKHDTQGTKPLLGKGELGYDDYVAGGDVGRVYVGTGSENIALAEKSEIDSHVNKVDNPHSVTKVQVGLGNVDNTADVNKNVATAVKAFTLGEVRQFPTDNNQDFNSCTDGGVYSVLYTNFTGTLNAPPTGQGYGTLLVEYGSLFMTQTFTAVNETITYKRTKYIGASWSAWTKVISEDANGNVGIGTSNPSSSLTIKDGITLINQLDNSTARPALMPGVQKYGVHVGTGSEDHGFLRLSAGGGTATYAKSYIDLSGYSTVPDMDRNIVFGTNGSERMRIDLSGNVGIGTNSPSNFEGYNTLTITGKDTSHGGVIELNNSDGSNKVQMVNTGDIFNIGTVTNHPVKLRTGATSRLSIEANGHTTVGTPIVSEATGAQLRVEALAAADSSTASMLISRYNDNYSSAMWHTYDSTYGNESFNLSVSPLGGGSSLDGNYRKYSALSNGLHKWFGGTALSNPMTLESSGNLLVGTQVDDGLSKLQIGGSVSIGGSISNWSNFNAVSLRGPGSAIVGGIASAGGGGNSNFLFNNCYYNGGWKHSYDGSYPATLHEYGEGRFIWYSAASDTGGNTADFYVDMILTGGNFGIGTSSPVYKVDTLGGSGNGYRYSNGTTSVTMGVSEGRGQIGTTTNDRLDLLVGGTAKATISTDGNVGIGDVAPECKLSVVASSVLSNTAGDIVTSFSKATNVDGNVSQLQFQTVRTLTGSAHYTTEERIQKVVDYTSMGYVGFGDNTITFGIDGSTERMRIGANGNLLVGTETDNGVDKLQVNGSISSGAIREVYSGDLNDYKTRTETIMAGNAMSNIPVLQHGYLEVIYWAEGWCLQRFTCTGYPDVFEAGKTFVRTLSNTAWSPWVEK